MDNQRKAELLAPAGSYEGILAVAAAGADAVYAGGQMFGARAYAQNLTQEELFEAMDYLHIHGKKLYLTVNTLLKERELQEGLYDYLKPLYERGLDAVIVQDMGVLSFVHRCFPDLHIHASTQMTVTGKYGAACLEELGVTRVIPARELSLMELREIREACSLEIETFVHGAICYCYSGQCLFSSMLGGRSGNRGRCAQPCRLPYTLLDAEGHPLNREVKRRDGTVAGSAYLLNREAKGGSFKGQAHAVRPYVLSLKDMCTIDLLPQILDAGVFSLKIEGRMKKPAYAAGVVSIYRKYLDMALEGKDADREKAGKKGGEGKNGKRGNGGYHVEDEDRGRLKALFNRDGFHTGYYLDRNGPEMIAAVNKKQEYTAADAQKDRESPWFAGIEELCKKPVRKCLINGKMTMHTGERMQLELAVEQPRNSEGLESVTVQVDGDVVQEARNRPLTEERVREQLQKTGNTWFAFRQLEISVEGDGFVPMTAINKLRRRALDVLKDKLLQPYRKLPLGDVDAVGKLDVGEKPDVERESTAAGKPYVAGKADTTGGTDPAGETYVTPQLCASAETKEQVKALLEIEEIDGICASCELFMADGESAALAFLDAARRAGKDGYIALPYVVREGDEKKLDFCFTEAILQKVKGFLLRNLESYGILKKRHLQSCAVLDANLYTWNSAARQSWREQGVLWDTMPAELNAGELRRRDNTNSTCIVYGYTPLMISAQCLQKNFDHCDRHHTHLTLNDRYHKNFFVHCACDFCYNIIYNSVPLGLAKERDAVLALRPGCLRLSFTTENAVQTANIARRYADLLKTCVSRRQQVDAAEQIGFSQADAVKQIDFPQADAAKHMDLPQDGTVDPLRTASAKSSYSKDRNKPVRETNDTRGHFRRGVE